MNLASKRLSGPRYQRWMQFAVGIAAGLVFMGPPLVVAVKTKAKEYSRLNSLKGNEANLHEAILSSESIRLSPPRRPVRSVRPVRSARSVRSVRPTVRKALRAGLRQKHVPAKT